MLNARDLLFLPLEHIVSVAVADVVSQVPNLYFVIIIFIINNKYTDILLAVFFFPYEWNNHTDRCYIKVHSARRWNTGVRIIDEKDGEEDEE